MTPLKRLAALVVLAAHVLTKQVPPPDTPVIDPYTVAPLHGDLVVNGGFEDVSGTGWTVDDPTIGFNTGSNAYSGFSYAYLGTVDFPGTISQTVATTGGTTYFVNFHYRSDGALSSSFTFTLNGIQLYSIADDPVHGNILKTFAFTTPSSGPTATSNTIAFTVRNDPGFFTLDDVTIVQQPVPCPGTDFYEFDPLTGDLVIESGKKYPSPPQPDTTFPVITDEGWLLFNYKSPPTAPTYPRVIYLGLSPPGDNEDFDFVDSECRWEITQHDSCDSFTDIGFVFSTSQPGAIPESFETLYIKGCVSRTYSLGDATVTYSGDAFTIWQDPWTLGHRWSQLEPFTFSMTLPYVSTASTSAVVDVVSDVPTIEYQPIEVINTGTSSNPIVQFTTIARTYYPFVAFGSGTKYTPPSSSQVGAADPSGHGTCVLYEDNGHVTDTTFCDAHPGVCTVECTRIIPITAPVCDLSGYTWEFDFNEYQDYPIGNTAVADTPSFSKDLLFDSSPVWNVCPTADATDYSSLVSSEAIHGHYDGSGTGVPDPVTPASINTPLNFGFKITLDEIAAPNNRIYKATLTEMKVARPDLTEFFLVGSSAGPTTGGDGVDQNRVHDLTFNPSAISHIYGMLLSPQVAPSDPKFAEIAVTFTPNVGSSSGPYMLYYSDSSSPVTLTVTFAGVISLFADQSTPSKRSTIFFKRQVTMTTPQGTFANSSNVVHGYGSGNSTTIVIEVPSLVKAVNAATIAGSVVGGVFGLLLIGVAIWFYRKSKNLKAREVSLGAKLETGSL